MGDISDKFLQLRPRYFRYNSLPDHEECGLIAEEVNDIYPDIVIKNDRGECETIQYKYLYIHTLNELQYAMRKINILNEEISILQDDISAMIGDIKAIKIELGTKRNK